MVLHLTNNPAQQLLSIAFTNLNVAGLIQLAAKLVGCNLTLAHGSETLFFKTLTVYLSTGVVLNGKLHPAGIRFSTNMLIFGKEAAMDAVLTREKVAIKGYIQAFNLGPLKVSGVTLDDPSIDIEFSSSVQKVHIDGAVKFGDSAILVSVHVEYAPLQTFNFYIQVKFVDAFKFEVIATLEGAVGKGIDGREFNLLGTMEQDLVGYIVDLANDHLLNDGKKGRSDSLRAEATKALKEFKKVNSLYAAKDQECKEVVNMVVDQQKLKRMVIEQRRVGADGTLQTFRVSLENEVRGFDARTERQRGKRNEEERVKTAALTEAVDCLILAERDLERVEMKVSERERTKVTALAAKLAATGMLSHEHPLFHNITNTANRGVTTVRGSMRGGPGERAFDDRSRTYRLGTISRFSFTVCL